MLHWNGSWGELGQKIAGGGVLSNQRHRGKRGVQEMWRGAAKPAPDQPSTSIPEWGRNDHPSPAPPSARSVRGGGGRFEESD